MISDGQGFNGVRATECHAGKKAGYEHCGHNYAMHTNSANNPSGYNPAAMAADFNYAQGGAADSASAATAMYAGVKIFDGQINGIFIKPSPYCNDRCVSLRRFAEGKVIGE